jgi:hypothetical protein
MGRSISIRYTVEVDSVSGVNSPCEWRTRRRGVVPAYGAPTVSNLRAFLRAFNESLKPGGANAHLPMNARAVSARIIDQTTRTVVAVAALANEEN